MKVVCKMAGRILVDRKGVRISEELCKVDYINQMVLKRRRGWSEHIDRMTDDRIVNITRDRVPIERKIIGTPFKGWSDILVETEARQRDEEE